MNSYEGEYTAKPERNPDDKDTRLKDFKEPNMNPQSLKSFRRSFDANAFVWVWVCSFDIMFKVVLDDVTENNKYRKTAPGKLKDTETLTLNYTKETYKSADYFYSRDKQFFPPKNSKGEYPYTFERTFSKIRQFFKRGLYNTYCSQISIASKKKCYGALPGTYASFEKRLKKHELMLVPTRKCVCQQSNAEEREKCCNEHQLSCYYWVFDQIQYHIIRRKNAGNNLI